MSEDAIGPWVYRDEVFPPSHAGIRYSVTHDAIDTLDVCKRISTSAGAGRVLNHKHFRSTCRIVNWDRCNVYNKAHNRSVVSLALMRQKLMQIKRSEAFDLLNRFEQLREATADNAAETPADEDEEVEEVTTTSARPSIVPYNQTISFCPANVDHNLVNAYAHAVLMASGMNGNAVIEAMKPVAEGFRIQLTTGIEVESEEKKCRKRALEKNQQVDLLVKKIKGLKETGFHEEAKFLAQKLVEL